MSPRLKTLMKLLKAGQLVVSGGGCTVRQLPSGEYEISLSSGDLNENNGRLGRGGGGGVDNGEASGTSTKPPRRFPRNPQQPSSGTYGGLGRGRTIDGVGGRDLY